MVLTRKAATEILKNLCIGHAIKPDLTRLTIQSAHVDYNFSIGYPTKTRLSLPLKAIPNFKIVVKPRVVSSVAYNLSLSCLSAF
ncbi:MAG: hypothetical protein UV38_C0001G0158 [candidate division TM6 bacterium GW2011_GWE2_42_60]|nr:MAG: hypothetical protein UV38_C0001G0158 [candidate division TM6 bacterium GW2011_GWE2_42_60]